MKKLLVTIITVSIAALFVCSCGGSKNKKSTKIAGNENSPQLVTEIEGSDISNQWTILDMDICKGFTSALALQGEHRDLAGQVRIFHPADENMIQFRSHHNNSFLCGAEI